MARLDVACICRAQRCSTLDLGVLALRVKLRARKNIKELTAEAITKHGDANFDG